VRESHGDRRGRASALAAKLAANGTTTSGFQQMPPEAIMRLTCGYAQRWIRADTSWRS